MHSSAPPSIPGTLLHSGDADVCRDKVRELLGRDSRRFPGAQPVSFARHHLDELQRNEYFMCEKTDGIRCLLLLDLVVTADGELVPRTLCIDRKNNYYAVEPPVRVPYWEFPRDADKFLYDTLLDGELVHDRVDAAGAQRLIFYVFDCLVFDRKNYTPKLLDGRLGCIKQRIFEPYYKRFGKPPTALPPYALELKEKEVYLPWYVDNMFKNVLPRLPHGNDGLIFTCKNTPYKFGTDDHILKWKPPHENTVDFKLRLGQFPEFDPQDGEDGLIPDYDAMPDRFLLLVLYEKRRHEAFQHDLHVDEDEWESLKALGEQLDGRIIECFREDSGRWRYKREEDGRPRWRDDKSGANHISTVNSVLESIEDPVTENDLIAMEGKVKEAVYRLRDEQRRRERDKRRATEPMEREAKRMRPSETNGTAH